MSTSFTFESVCQIIKKKYPDDAKLIDAIDLLLGTAMVLSPLVLGPVGTPALALLGVKSELVKIGKRVYEKLTAKPEEEEDALKRSERMNLAYCLISYTAFFDALDEVLKAVRKDISLSAKASLKISDGCGSSS